MSIGAGIVVGGFVAAVEGVVTERPRVESEGSAVVGSCIGGLICLLLLIVDTLGKYFV